MMSRRKTKTVTIPEEVMSLIRLGALLRGLGVREYIAAVIVEFVRADNELLLSQPLRLLRGGEFQPTPLPSKRRDRGTRP